MLYTVIVNWNLKDDTLACIDSLSEAGLSPDQIVLVDNGSSDGSVDALRARFGSSMHLIENTENLGFAVGTNQGIKYALKLGAQWVLLLNNDTVVGADFLEQMNRALNGDLEYAILAPLIFYYDQPNCVWFLGDYLIPGTLFTRNSFQNRPAPEDLPDIVPVDFVTGCALFVRRDVFEEIGFLDESLVMYGEEIDFIWRARLSGYTTACITQAHMWHKVSLSANRVKPQTRYYRIRNQIRFYRKYSHGLQRPLMFGATIVRALGIAFSDIKNRQTDMMPHLVRGWIDGWKL